MYYKIFLLLFFTLYHNISHISHHPTQISLLHRRPDQQHEKKVFPEEIFWRSRHLQRG